MGIDWFTLGAQVVNFLVLVALLKHFFYDRIIGAMDEREAAIASRLEGAARERESAAEEAALYRSRNRELEAQRERLLAEAAEDARALRHQLVEAARREAEEVRAQWRASLENERRALLQEFRERLGRSVVGVARRALAELADAQLEAQVLKVFVERVRGLDTGERETIVAALRDSSREVEIRTAFPLDAPAREELARALRAHLDEGIALRFTTVPQLVCGIELRAHSYRLSWNLDTYHDGLEAQVSEALDEGAEPREPAR